MGGLSTKLAASFQGRVDDDFSSGPKGGDMLVHLSVGSSDSDSWIELRRFGSGEILKHRRKWSPYEVFYMFCYAKSPS